MSIQFKRLHILDATPVQIWVRRTLVTMFLGAVITYFIHPHYTMLVKQGVSWYCPYKMLHYSEEQVQLNLGNPKVFNVIPSNLKEDSSVLHIIIIDHTTPFAGETYYEKNLADFPKKSYISFPGNDHGDKYSSILQKVDSARLSTQLCANLIGVYFNEQGLNNKFAIFNYAGNEQISSTDFDMRNCYLIPDADQEGKYYQKNADKLDFIINSCLEKETLSKGCRTNFADVLHYSKNAYQTILNTEKDKYEKYSSVTIDIISDFIHEKIFEKQKSVTLKEVERNAIDFVRVFRKVSRINLFVLPSRQADTDKKIEIDEWLRNTFATIIAKDSLSINILPEYALQNSDALLKECKLLTSPIVVEKEAIPCFYSFKSNYKEDFSTYRIKFDKTIDQIRITTKSGFFSDALPRVELVSTNDSQDVIPLSNDFYIDSLNTQDTFEINVWDGKEQPVSSDMAIEYNKKGCDGNGNCKNSRHLVYLNIKPKISLFEAIMLRFFIFTSFLLFIVYMIQIITTNCCTKFFKRQIEENSFLLSLGLILITAILFTFLLVNFCTTWGFTQINFIVYGIVISVFLNYFHVEELKDLPKFK